MWRNTHRKIEVFKKNKANNPVIVLQYFIFFNLSILSWYLLFAFSISSGINQ